MDESTGQSIELSKAICYFHQKSLTKNHLCKCVEVPQFPISKSVPPFSVPPSFLKVFSTPRINSFRN